MVHSEVYEFLAPLRHEFAWFVVDDVTRPDVKVEIAYAERKSFSTPDASNLRSVRRDEHFSTFSSDTLVLERVREGSEMIAQTLAYPRQHRQLTQILRPSAPVYASISSMQHLWQLATFESSSILSVHATGMCLDGKAYLFPAATRGGKTTLSVALAHVGFSFYSGDRPLLNRVNSDWVVVANPLCLRFEADSLANRLVGELFPEAQSRFVKSLPDQRLTVNPVDLGVGIGKPAKPAAVFFLALTGKRESTFEEIPKKEALELLARRICEFPSHLLHRPTSPRQFLGQHADATFSIVQNARCYMLNVGVNPTEAATLVTRLVRG